MKIIVGELAFISQYKTIVWQSNDGADFVQIGELHRYEPVTILHVEVSYLVKTISRFGVGWIDGTMFSEHDRRWP